MLHEEILQKYLHVPEALVYGVHKTMVFIWLIRFRALILKTESLFECRSPSLARPCPWTCCRTGGSSSGVFYY